MLKAGPLTLTLWGLTILAIVFVVVYPTYRIIYLAVSDPQSGALEFGTLRDVFMSPQTWIQTRNTFIMAAAATAIAVLIAVPMAWSCTRTNMFARRTVSALVFLTFMNPPVLLAYAYILIAGPNNGMLTGWLASLGIPNIYSWWGLIFATFCGAYPIIFMTTASALQSMDPDLENAATAHGAGRLRTVLRVSVPLVSPAIASGCLLAFVLALNAFGVQALIAIPGRIPLLTTAIYGYFSYPVQFTAAADLAVLLIIASVVVTLVANVYIARRSFPTIFGKGVMPAAIQLSWRSRTALGVFNWLVLFITLILPMGIVILSSFVRVQGRGFSWSNLSFDAYVSLGSVDGGAIFRALRNSFVLGLVATAAMLLIAVSLAYFQRQRIRGSSLTQHVASIPFVIPGIVLAIGFIGAYSRPPINLYGTLAILALAYISKFMPIAFRFVDNALGQVSMELEEGAYAHGASRARAFWVVLLPLVKRGLVAAGLLSFVFSFNELSASILLIGTGTEVTSTIILRYSELGLLSQLNAFAAILFLITAACYAAIMRFAGRSVLENAY